MSEDKPKTRHPRLPRAIEIDAAIDTGLYRAGRGIARAFTAWRRFMDRFRPVGAWKYVVDILDELATFGVAGFVLMLALALPAFDAVRGDWLSQDEIAVTILDRYGTEIGRRGILQNDSVPLTEMPAYLIQAALATEDRRFYSHFGIDIPGTLRALITNARAQGVVQGGSSITQQLAKNLFLSNERTLERKIKEAFLALWLEVNLTKDEILKLYLDRAYMGGGAFGVVAASEFYFGKDVRELTLAEAAMLAGLFKAPTAYAPHVDLAAARARAAEVLGNMVEAGFLSEGQVLAALNNPATPVARARAGTAPDFFLDYIYDEVRRLAPSDVGSVIVTSTLEPRIQSAAEAVIETNLREFGAATHVRQAAAVILSSDGAVRGMVGGRDYGESQFNRAVYALRQPGSSFKPFVYTTALLNGYTPDSVVPDAPITIGNWSPRNYSRGYAGNVTLLTALTRSINTIPVRLAQALGRDHIIETAHRMGIRSELPITRALPLGVAEVTIIDMASAYGVFSNGGYRATAYGIARMTTSTGRVIYDRATQEAAAPRILPVDVIEGMNRMLVSVVENGTARRAQLEGITTGGKTGTTQAYRDAWFVGFTGAFTGAVWFGNDDYTSTAGLTGGRLPAMAWGEIMRVAHQGVARPLLPGIDVPIIDSPTMQSEGGGFGGGNAPTTLSPHLSEVLRAISRRLSPASGQQSLLMPTPGDAVDTDAAATLRGALTNAHHLGAAAPSVSQARVQ